MAIIFRQNCEKTFFQFFSKFKWASRNSEAFEPFEAEMQHPVQNRPWVPHAGGQDDGSLHKLPQENNYLFVSILYLYIQVLRDTHHRASDFGWGIIVIW